MSLTTAETTDLLRRAKLSELRGYTIARGDYYAQELGASDSSPAALIAACQAALGTDAKTDEPPALGEGEGGKPKALPQHGSEGRSEPASPIPPQRQPEPEPEPEAEEEPHDDNAETYDSWSKKKLLAAANERGLDVKANNTKAEIIAALRAADGR